MLIRMTTSVSGADWQAAPGDEVDRPDDEAARFVAAGYAEPVEPVGLDAKPPRRSRRETAAAPAGRETADAEG